jgi:hypothetical protein
VQDRTTIIDTLRSLADVMKETGVRWYVFGAQAAIIWGSPRWSADVDVTAEIDASRIDIFVGSMKRRGFDLLIDDADFVARTRVLPFRHTGSLTPVDVVIAGPGLEEDFMDRSLPTDVGGTQVPVVTPEDLIIAKVLAGRSKDIEDIRHVVHQHRPTLDVERIRRILLLLEDALTRSDLLPVFDNEWHRS